MHKTNAEKPVVLKKILRLACMIIKSEAAGADLSKPPEGDSWGSGRPGSQNQISITINQP